MRYILCPRRTYFRAVSASSSIYTYSIRAGCSAERRDTRLAYDLNGCDLESCGTRLSIEKRCTIHTTSTNHRHDITTDTHWRMRNCVSRDRKTGRSRHLKALVLATREPCAAKRHRRRAPLSRRTALVHPASARCTRHIFTPAVWAAIVRPTAACADAKRAKQLDHGLCAVKRIGERAT